MTLSGNEKNLAVMGITTVVLGLPSLAFVLHGQTTEMNLLIVLHALGRLSFFVFLLIVIIRPLQELIGSPVTRTLLRNRRYVGIVLATAMTVHLGFIAWRFAVVRAETRRTEQAAQAG